MWLGRADSEKGLETLRGLFDILKTSHIPHVLFTLGIQLPVSRPLDNISECRRETGRPLVCVWLLKRIFVCNDLKDRKQYVRVVKKTLSFESHAAYNIFSNSSCDVIRSRVVILCVCVCVYAPRRCYGVLKPRRTAASSRSKKNK